MFAVADPMAFSGDPFAGGNGGKRGDDGNEVAVTFDFDAQDAEAGLFLEKSDALDETGNGFDGLGRLGHISAQNRGFLRAKVRSLSRGPTPGRSARAEKWNTWLHPRTA